MPGTYSLPHIYTAGDDALRAVRVLDSSNHIVLFTPTSPRTHEYYYQPLAEAISRTHGKNVFAMDYTPPTNKNRYLPFDHRHEAALMDNSCAAVIVVIRDDSTKTRGCQMDFARKVWDVACAEQDIPGILVEIGGSRRLVGGWKTILYSNIMSEASMQELAQLIFGC
ncbi:uncharacterized protein PV09_09174 [Verruconis gallopava]|uniref:Uncharacterized protein n=1 Tax=Verruconis gallopava TaxID=253628 RepID=A0A0D1ZYJ1_9PEZI|nr:uncharacterized protein PV09_09174 [Verruconis gallopava]KIV99144.1 hypothetical protein PV09_09174 [Verruconis gallopava]